MNTDNSILVWHEESVSHLSVYTNNSFTGHYPVGSAAVVIASGPQEAAAMLNAELRSRGLDGDVKPEDMLAMGPDSSVRVLCDGDY